MQKERAKTLNNFPWKWNLTVRWKNFDSQNKILLEM